MTCPSAFLHEKFFGAPLVERQQFFHFGSLLINASGELIANNQSTNIR